MPSDDVSGRGMPGSTALSQLNDLIDDKAGATEAGKEDGQPAKPLSISITRQETYLPPVMRLSPFQQVVEPIRQAAVDLAASRAEAVPELGSDKPNEISAPTKILHIELRPVELGSITVKLRLSQGGMEIRLEASRAETAQMLANDKDALREVIKASGYSIDAVSVETVHIDAPASDRQAGQDNASNERPGGRDGDGRGFEQSRQGEHRQEPRQRGWGADIASSKDESHDLDDARSKGRDPSRYL
jgi:flagellar hook-length control protein FliK